jgi:hypothetical protein
LTSNGAAAPVWKTFPSTFKNKIVNADLSFNQWGDSVRNNPLGGVYVPSVAGDVYLADMFYLRTVTANSLWGTRFQSAYSWGNSSFWGRGDSIGSPPNVSYFLGIRTPTAITPSASSINALCHAIEISALADILATPSSTQPFVLSFYVYSSIAGTYSGCINSVYGTPRCFPFNYTIATANVWQKITVAVPSDTFTLNGEVYLTDGYAGLSILWNLGSGASPGTGTNYPAGAWVTNTTGVTSLARSNTSGLVSIISNTDARFYIGQIQLELGTSDTPFENLPPAINQVNCQRYFESSYSINESYGRPGDLNGGKFSVKFVGPSGFTQYSANVKFSNLKALSGNGGSPNKDAIQIYSTASGNIKKVYDKNSLSDLSVVTPAAISMLPSGFVVNWVQPSASGVDVEFSWVADTMMNVTT